MTTIRFYHLTKLTTDQFIPKLLQKLYAGLGYHQLLLRVDQERIDYYDDHLWAFDEQSFLPHTHYDPNNTTMNTNDHPIIVHHDLVDSYRQYINIAPTDLLTDHLKTIKSQEKPSHIDIWCEVFMDQDDEHKHHSRQLWMKLKELGHNSIEYYAQTNNGFEKKVF